MPLCEATAIPTSTSKEESSVPFITSYCIHHTVHTVHTALRRFKGEQAWRGAQRNGGTQSACEVTEQHAVSVCHQREHRGVLTLKTGWKVLTQSAKQSTRHSCYHWLLHKHLTDASSRNFRSLQKSIRTYRYCQAKNVANRNPQNGDNWAYL